MMTVAPLGMVVTRALVVERVVRRLTEDFVVV